MPSSTRNYFAKNAIILSSLSKGAIHKGRPHREEGGEGGSPKADIGRLRGCSSIDQSNIRTRGGEDVLYVWPQSGRLAGQNALKSRIKNECL